MADHVGEQAKHLLEAGAQSSSHDRLIQAIERQTAVLGKAMERQAVALERIADALAGAQSVSIDDVDRRIVSALMHQRRGVIG